VTSLTEDTVLAPSWPLGDLDVAPPVIGDQLVARKKTPAVVKALWNDEGDPFGENELSLCGTMRPGNVHLECLGPWDARGVEPRTDWPEAGVWWMEQGLVWICRPFTGEPLGDPRVLVEGDLSGYWLMTPEGSSDDWFEDGDERGDRG
jgi:hypothetical protein